MQVNPLGKVPALQDGDLTLVRPASTRGTFTLTTCCNAVPRPPGAVRHTLFVHSGLFLRCVPLMHTALVNT